MNTENPSREVLAKKWNSEIFEEEIFPGFPFRPVGWRAIAFDRDKEGSLRMPLGIWRKLLREIRGFSGQSAAFVISPVPISSGLVAERSQPFIVPLTEKGIVGHFSDMNVYLPEFFMGDASSSWAIWGDSDITVLGGKNELIDALVDEIGGREEAVKMMLESFGVDGVGASSEMVDYLTALLPVED
jgi:hypothetical protein